MKNLTIINDTHLGVKRNAGATPESNKALRDYQFNHLSKLLDTAKESCLIVNGDLFDTFLVDNETLLLTYTQFVSFLSNTENQLILVAGNHDLSRDSSKLSSFHLLCSLLEGQGNFSSVFQPTRFSDCVYIVPHLVDQEAFNAALKDIPKCESTKGIVLLHANFDNGFADGLDHSLNMSREQAQDLISKNWTLVFGHEHQSRTVLKDRVVCVGNQIPTSIADCLTTVEKYYAKYTSTVGVTLVPYMVLNQGIFVDIPWTEVKDTSPEFNFIRVSGKFEKHQSIEVAEVIYNLRKKSSAFVISNATEVNEKDVLKEVQQETKLNNFDIRAYILNDTKAPFAAKLEKIMKEALNENQKG